VIAGQTQTKTLVDYCLTTQNSSLILGAGTDGESKFHLKSSLSSFSKSTPIAINPIFQFIPMWETTCSHCVFVYFLEEKRLRPGIIGNAGWQLL
jgi:hypothetical protein